MCLFIKAQKHRRIDRQLHIPTSGQKGIVYVHGCAEITEANRGGCRSLCCTRAQQPESSTSFSCSGPARFIDAAIGNSPRGANEREGRSQARKSRRRPLYVAFLADINRV